MNIQKKKVALINACSDYYACGYYRMIFPDMALKTNSRLHYSSIRLNGPTTTLTQTLNDKCIFKAQRFHTDLHVKYFQSYLEKVSMQTGAKIIYDIDDILVAEHMPHYNASTKEHEKSRQNITSMMNIANIVSVSTVELGMYYHKTLGVDLSKFRVVPNFMPKWWSNAPIMDKSLPKNRRPRIGFPCSYSHFNHAVDNTTDDDFHHIIQFIKDTCGIYEWVFFAHVPKLLWEELEQNKISVVNGSDFLNYINCVNDKKLDILVAPLENIVFNQAKSNIKLLEAASSRIPFIGQDLCTYNKYTDSVFNDANDLQNQIDRILKSKKSLNDEINKNTDFMNNDKSETRNNGWWIENNLHYHTDIYERLV